MSGLGFFAFAASGAGAEAGAEALGPSRSGEGEKAQTTNFPEHLSLLRQKKNTQPKRIYSANGNPFIPMICRFYAPLLFPNLCAILINDIIFHRG